MTPALTSGETSGVDALPPYSRGLLRIKVPVSVTLASKKQPIGRIVELGPGSIIQFDNSCKEMLEIRVGHQRVAEGEAVKVGEKFGIRITALVLPGERFAPLRNVETPKGRRGGNGRVKVEDPPPLGGLLSTRLDAPESGAGRACRTG